MIIFDREICNFDAVTTPRRAEEMCISALGGRPRGVLSIAMGIDPQTNAVIWNDEMTIFMQGKGLAEGLIERLSGSGIRPTSGHFTRVCLQRNAVCRMAIVERRTTSAPAAQGGAAAGRQVVHTAPIDQVKQTMLDFLYTDGTVTFPSVTSSGENIRWQDAPTTEGDEGGKQTQLEELPEPAARMGDIIDLRTVFAQAEMVVNAKVLFQAIADLVKENAICLEAPEDENGPYKVWSQIRLDAAYEDEPGEGAARRF